MAVEQAKPPEWASMTPGPGLAACLATLDPNTVPAEHLVALLQARWRQVNHDNAQYLATITLIQQHLEDPWATVAEVGAGLRFTDRRADSERLLAHQLAQRLPQVWAALNAGEIDVPKARKYAQYLAEPDSDGGVDGGPTDLQVAAICRRLLPKTPGWTTGQLAARLLRELLAIDPGFTRRRYQRAARDRGVWGYLSEDGTAVLSGHGLSPAEAAAAAERLEVLARQARAAGHPNTELQLRADLFIRLLDGRSTGQTQEQIITALLTEAATEAAAIEAAGTEAAGTEPAADAAAGTAAANSADADSADADSADAADADPADAGAAAGAADVGVAVANDADAGAGRAPGADTSGTEVGARGRTDGADPAARGSNDPARSTTDHPDLDHDAGHDTGAVAGFAAAATPANPATLTGSAAADTPVPDQAADHLATADAPDQPAGADVAAQPSTERGKESRTDPAPAPQSAHPQPAHPQPAHPQPAHPQSAQEPTPQPSRDPVAAPPRPQVGDRVGVEIRLGLGTLLGLDDHPGELPGWGPVLADVARLLAGCQHRAEWRFAILDDAGYLLYGGITRHRPPNTHPTSAGRVTGGVVEIHLRASLLTDLTRRPDLPPGWAPLIADLARRYATRDRDGHRLDACPDARLPGAGLRRHVQMRDRTCVAPGCRRPAIRTDQDHTVAYLHGGCTVSGNLGPLCARHHRMKHECGWTLEQPRPGFFHWRSPLAQHYYTRGEPIAPDLPDRIPRPDPSDDHDEGWDATRDQPIRPIFTPLQRTGRPPPQPEPAPAEDNTPPPF